VLWNIRGSHCRLADEKLLTAATIWLGARLSSRPFRIVNNSLASARQHEALLGFRRDRWSIIPNGFEVERFRPSAKAREEIRAELRLKSDSLLIGLIGRYHPMKDHSNFLSAAAILRHSVPGAQFVMAGAGIDPANHALFAQSRDLGLLDCTHLLGARTDIPRVTAALDIAGSSSYSEAFPNVIGEAMSCGVPCVVTDVGDSSWLAGDTGLSVPPRDPKALAEAWLSLIARGPEGRQALGAAARERIVERFSIGAIAAQYEALYDQALDSKRTERKSRVCAA
jgi:glycosyltransferase involved in cell wall biosynthesis